MNTTKTRRPSSWSDFWDGVASAFAFDGDIFPIASHPDRSVDRKNIRGDWGRVARDLAKAMERTRRGDQHAGHGPVNGQAAVTDRA